MEDNFSTDRGGRGMVWWLFKCITFTKHFISNLISLLIWQEVLVRGPEVGTCARRLLKPKCAGCKCAAGQGWGRTHSRETLKEETWAQKPDLEGGRKAPAACEEASTAGNKSPLRRAGGWLGDHVCRGCLWEMDGMSLNDWKVNGRSGLGVRSEIYGMGNQVPEKAYELRCQGWERGALASIYT